MDSRLVSENDLFIAIRGHIFDGRNYISQAIKKKVSAILCETDNKSNHEYIKIINNIPVIYCFKLSKIISKIAGKFYCHPDKKIKLIGVTGTNGKTSVTHLITQWVTIIGKQAAAVLGTLGNGLYNQLEPTENTTPSSIKIQSLLHMLQKQKINLVSMEVSSHALVQHRVTGLHFSVAVFTNITRDHLDYHRSMKAYKAAKWSFFSTNLIKKVVFNIDDPVGIKWIKKLQLKDSIAVTLKNKIQKKYFNKWIQGYKIIFYNYKTKIFFHSSWGSGIIRSNLIGKFNVSNILLAMGTLLSLGYSLSDLTSTSYQLKPIFGRMQIFKKPNKPTLVVDYAHTPNALKEALITLKKICQNKLWCIFGCGGDRDRGKRSIMGKIAEKIADFVIVTNDNPRNEKPLKIIQDILTNCINTVNLHVIPERKEAIKFALSRANFDDLILISGKGHEQEQIIGHKIIKYSDQKTILNLLE